TRPETLAHPSMGANRLSRRMARAGGPVAAWHSGMRVSLLLVSAVVVCLSRWRGGKLRGVAAGSLGSALSADRSAAVRRRGQRFARLRLGVSVRVSPGFAGQNRSPENFTAGLGRLLPLRGAGGTGDSAADNSWIQRHSV